MVLAKGDKADHVWFIKTNGIIITTADEHDSFADKIDQCVADLRVGGYFGETSILFDKASEFTFLALALDQNYKQTETNMFSISKKRFWKILTQHPKFADFLRDRAITRLTYWKCYELAKKQIPQQEFQTSREYSLKHKMAQKFFLNLTAHEIKAFLKCDFDPRFTSK